MDEQSFGVNIRMNLNIWPDVPEIQVLLYSLDPFTQSGMILMAVLGPRYQFNGADNEILCFGSSLQELR